MGSIYIIKPRCRNLSRRSPFRRLRRRWQRRRRRCRQRRRLAAASPTTCPRWCRWETRCRSSTRAGVRPEIDVWNLF